MEIKPVPTRDGFGEELVALGKSNPNVVVTSGDLEDATRAEYFKKEFPQRFFNLGITEQDVVGTAAGLSTQGYVAFATSFAVFLTNRAYDMIRMDVCYNNLNVKVVCSHGGITVGEDGASAQCLEDFAIMRVLPNMRVICPVDHIEARKATRAIANTFGPFYMRTSRAPFPVITAEGDPFVIGKANVLRLGRDATVIACGVMVSEALAAAEKLKSDGIDLRVVNMHTIKPVDVETIVAAAKETGAIVCAEEHQMAGGLGSAVAEILGRYSPCPLEILGIKDSFGESGTPAQLMVQYGLKDVNIVAAVKNVIKRKVSYA
ncbi:MAG: transketolase family protein [Candidatus Omnitrophica bacterium]|nr:transketolase family protein [Candidatus Omnitrophota bacterium]MDE2009040.1 transketolase family protein [Candidatus Omnitrophota bacterium]MDE2214295.1 transketolase family protein [Candidatus Omnitrophota bacterium]MDE2231332.1 transketolase family protein [Candidatus Omnitrophota bacterium]